MASNNTVINKLYKKNVLSYNSLKRSVDTIMQLLYYSKVPPQYNHTSTDAAQKYAKTHTKNGRYGTQEHETGHQLHCIAQPPEQCPFCMQENSREGF